MINFMRYRRLYFFISLLVIIPGLISLLLYGLKLSIDFTGGSVLEVRLNADTAITSTEVEAAITDTTPVNSIEITKDHKVIVHTQTINKTQAEAIKKDLASAFGEVEEIRFETVGPTIGQELIKKTLTAIALASVSITLYIMYRFKQLKYGISAILAMLHDTLIVVGIFSLLGHFYGVEVDALFVTAILTVLSFSVHDTIVVYDRIRETLRKNPKVDFVGTVNLAITETLSRSINNSMTIIFMLTALWLLGGETTKWFVFALLIGTIAGTYSSTFTAAPLLVVWENFKKKR